MKNLFKKILLYIYCRIGEYLKITDTTLNKADWIPADIKKPEIGKDVLLLLEIKYRNDYYQRDSKKMIKQSVGCLFYTYGQEHWFHPNYGMSRVKVTHWTDLPENP
jgi:hypothetical protein